MYHMDNDFQSHNNVLKCIYNALFRGGLEPDMYVYIHEKTIHFQVIIKPSLLYCGMYKLYIVAGKIFKYTMQ